MPMFLSDVQIVQHLGLMAAECELEAAKCPEPEWYAEFMKEVAAAYRDAQYNMLKEVYVTV